MYILIEFPEVQRFQERHGFNEHSEGSTDVDGAYYVDFAWVFNIDRQFALNRLASSVEEVGFSGVERNYVADQWKQELPFGGDGGMSSSEALIHILNNHKKRRH